jgi:hypothetical protein
MNTGVDLILFCTVYRSTVIYLGDIVAL